MIKKIARFKLETDNTQYINKLKKQIIKEVKSYCKQLNNGNQDFCYQDTMNKILYVEQYEDLKDLNLNFI